MARPDLTSNPMTACPACGATGHIGSDYCAVCQGDGYALKARIDWFTASHSAPKHACHAPHCRGLRRSAGLK